MKQTLARCKMCSRAPHKARCELQWTVLGLWALARISAEQIIRRGHDPLGLSVALARRRVRQAMRQTGRSARSPALLEQLGKSLKDSYVRTRPKKARPQESAELAAQEKGKASRRSQHPFGHSPGDPRCSSP